MEGNTPMRPGRAGVYLMAGMLNLNLGEISVLMEDLGFEFDRDADEAGIRLYDRAREMMGAVADRALTMSEAREVLAEDLRNYSLKLQLMRGPGL